MPKLFNPLRIQIHIWGGLGSQLYGVNCYLKLASLFPNRKFKLVFHSSGVSRRPVEIDTTKLINCKIIFKDDYLKPDTFNSKKIDSKLKKIFFKIRFVFVNFIILGKFIMKIENNQDLQKLRAWTTIIRGHYTYLEIPKNNLIFLKEIGTKLTNLNVHESKYLGVQLRLGDLLRNVSKQQIEYNRFNSCLKKIIESQKVKLEILAFSDSDLNNENTIKQDYFSGVSFRFVKCDTGETLNILSSGYALLGSTSKISIWAALFFNASNQSRVYLPEELKSIIFKNIGVNEMNFY